MVCSDTHYFVQRLFRNLKDIVPSWSFELYSEDKNQGRWIVRDRWFTDRFIGVIAECPHMGKISVEMYYLYHVSGKSNTEVLINSSDREALEGAFRKCLDERYQKSNQPIL